MATYLVSYDLNREGGKEESYPELIAAIRRDGGVKILFSEWLVRSAGNGAAVRDRYRAHMDGNDRIFVTSVEDWAYSNIMNEQQARPMLPG